MNVFWIVILAMIVLGVSFGLKRMSFIAEETAREHLANGALVIDVRSPEEFRNGHVPGAINLPLGELRENLLPRVPDRQQVLLVHCLSGGRSAIAKQQLKRMGYANVFNLGSLARAQQIVAGARSK